jgi:hypothetical protein
MTNHTNEEIWQYLGNVNNPEQPSSEQQMIFDPSTGDFKVLNSGDSIPEGGVIVDPSTLKGFWFM